MNIDNPFKIKEKFSKYLWIYNSHAQQNFYAILHYHEISDDQELNPEMWRQLWGDEDPVLNFFSSIRTYIGLKDVTI